MAKQKTKRLLLIRCFLPLTLLVVVLIASFVAALGQNHATAATNSTINFQARLLNAAGSIVPDGNYNVEFKLYNASSSSGSSQGSCSGDSACLWTETRTTTNKVRVANGYLTVNLGSVNAFASTINWDQELWLTMNIGGTGAPGWDGEMTPRLKLTAVPYAFRAGQLVTQNGASTNTLSFAAPSTNQTVTIPDETGVICLRSSSACGFLTPATADGNYIHNTTTIQTSANIAIQSTGDSSITVALKARASQSADLLQLQNSSGTPIFAISAAGNITTGSYQGSVIGVQYGGTGAATFASNGVLYGNGTAALQATAAGTTGQCLVATTSAAPSWGSCGGGGVTTVGTFSASSQTNGASISGSTITFGPADTTNPGMVSTGAQTIAGAKTFNSSLNVATGQGYQINASNVLTASALSFTAASTASIQSAASQALNITGHAASTLSTDSGALTLTSAATATWGVGGTNQSLTLQASGTGTIDVQTAGAGTVAIGNANSTTINIAANSLAHAINIGTSSGAAQTIGIGSIHASSTTLIQGGTGAAALTLDTGASGTIIIGTTNSQTISIGSAGLVNNTVYVGANAASNSTVAIGNTAAASSTLIQGGTGGAAISIQAGATGFITIGTTNSNTITLGNATTTTTLTLGQSTASNTINIGNATTATGNTQTINIGTSATGTGKAVITIGNTNDTSALNLQAGTGNLTLLTNSASAKIIIKSNTNDDTAFQVQDSSSNAIVNVDTTNQRLGVNTISPSANLQVNQGTLAPGTVSNSASSASVTGTSTTFTATFAPGDSFTITSSGNTCAILSITSDTALTCTAALAGASSGSAYTPGNSTRLAVKQNGNVGIGTGSPTRRLHATVNDAQTTSPMALLEQTGTGDATIEFKTSAKSFIMGQDGSDSSTFKISSSTASSSATFGNTTVGANTDGGSQDFATCSKYTTSQAGTATSMSVYTGTVDTNPNNLFQVAIYTDNGGSPSSPTTLVASSASATVAGSNAWSTVSIAASLSASTVYWLCYNTNGNNNLKYDTGAANQMAFQNHTFGTWGSPSYGTINGRDNWAISLYVTYTPTGSYDSFAVPLLSLDDTGRTTFKNSTNSTAAFQIQNAAGTSNLLVADTTNTRIGIGKAAPTATLDVSGSINSSGGAVTLLGNAASSLTTSSGALTLTAAATSTWSTSGGDLTLQAAGVLNLGTGGGTTINMGTNSSAHTIGIGTGAAVQTITIGSTTTTSATTIQAGTGNLNFLTNSASASIIAKSLANSATAFQIQNSTGAAYLTIDTLNAQINIGDTIATASIRLGDSTNNASFAASTHELTLNGNARHTRRITLQPEFAGAVMTAQNGCSSCSGSMTSDAEPAAGASTLSSAEGYAHSFYSWTTTQASNQNYDIWVSYTLPSDFSAFASSTPVSVWTKTTNTTNGTVSMQIFDADRSPANCYGGGSDSPVSLTPSSANTWQEITPGTSITSGGCSFVANDRIWVRFRLQAPQSGITRLGELRFDYLSKW